MTSVVDLGSFSAILYSIKPDLFLVILGYSVFGTAVTTSLGKSLIPLNFEQLRREANFRYSLVRVRENAESIAFYRGEAVEADEIGTRFGSVIDNSLEIIKTTRNLEFFTTSYRYLIQVLPVSVVAPQYFAGSIPLGVVTQTSGAFNHILSDLSVIVNQFEQLSAFSAGVSRLSDFYNAITNTNTNSTEIGNTTTSTSIRTDTDTNTNTNTIFSANSLRIETPDRRRVLQSNLSFQVKKNEHLLIVGSSGSGKSSLLRVIAGLWNSGDGSISTPPASDVFFLPQRPYCPLGTLRNNLLYPGCDEDEGVCKNDDGELLKILSLVGLERLASDGSDGLESVQDWSNILSLGEQQRVAFARLMLNQPKLALLDEATSALDADNEEKMYKLLLGMDETTFISVGHRPSLEEYHKKKLRLV